MQAHCNVRASRFCAQPISLSVTGDAGLDTSSLAASRVISTRTRRYPRDARRIQRFPALVELYDNTASLQDRTVGTGIVWPRWQGSMARAVMWAAQVRGRRLVPAALRRLRMTICASSDARSSTRRRQRPRLDQDRG
jgi:hypothetical protein